MSDTVWDNGTVSFTRFWGGEKGDCIQITMGSKYECLTLAEFREAVAAIEKNVEDTKDAFWHNPEVMDVVARKLAEIDRNDLREV